MYKNNYRPQQSVVYLRYAALKNQLVFFNTSIDFKYDFASDARKSIWQTSTLIYDKIPY